MTFLLMGRPIDWAMCTHFEFRRSSSWSMLRSCCAAEPFDLTPGSIGTTIITVAHHHRHSWPLNPNRPRPISLESTRGVDIEAEVAARPQGPCDGPRDHPQVCFSWNVIERIVFARNQINRFGQPEASHICWEYTHGKTSVMRLFAHEPAHQGDKSTAYILIPRRARIRAVVPVPQAKSLSVLILAKIRLSTAYAPRRWEIEKAETVRHNTAPAIDNCQLSCCVADSLRWNPSFIPQAARDPV